MKKKIVVAVLVSLVLLPPLFYFGGNFLLGMYVTIGAKRLIALEEKGLLSTDYGFVWQEINLNAEMAQAAQKEVAERKKTGDDQKEKIRDFPSLAAVTELNQIRDFRKTIRVTDRHGIPLSEIQTTHTCVSLDEIDDLLLKALIITEDQRFYERKNAYDYKALVRSLADALARSASSGRLLMPRGTSTIHMQVARFLMLRTNNLGYAYSQRGIANKLKELQLAQALKKRFTDEEILTVYINHCVSAGRGMRGYYDISRGLFGKPPNELDTAQNLYLARLVRWNRHLPGRIIAQVKASMPELANHLQWSDKQVESIKGSLDNLTFQSPRPIIPRHSHILDLANEYWRKVAKSKGMSTEEVTQMDIANPESMVRRFGNLTIQLTIDYRLQRYLEKQVDSRGFGPDTVIRTDRRIGSKGINLEMEKLPPDTLRRLYVLQKDSVFTDPVSKTTVQLNKNDTIVTNIRYRSRDGGVVRRSCFYYLRDTMSVPGQYYAYAMMDSKNHQLLAYYSKDRLGSRLTSLLRNRIPNGSSIAKPILFALAYDLGIYRPYEMASDELEISDSVAWARTLLLNDKEPVGMRYINAQGDQGYPVHNHHRSFDGYDFLYNHLARSNNILTVETIYRLNTDLKETENSLAKEVIHFYKRLGLQVPRNEITGPDIYKAIAGIIADPSAVKSSNTPSDLYSVALGTLELSLFEQMYLFNALHNNKLVLQPANNPGLVLKQITLAGRDIQINDTLRHVELLGDPESLKPVQLALHKRLTSSPQDNLGSYDICLEDSFREGVVSNFAKSGTTDHIIRPFNADVNDASRTNYGLWNAVLRLRLTREDLIRSVEKDKWVDTISDPEKIPEEELLDVTLTGIAEGNLHYTGARDGKGLHGYLSRNLLHDFGISCTEGFYSDYESQITNQVSRDEIYSFQMEETDLSLLSRTFIRLRTGLRSDIEPDEVVFERARRGRLRLRGKNYSKMLSFAPYLGEQSEKYHNLVNELRNPGSKERAESVLAQILELEPDNRFLKRDIQTAIQSLLSSLKN
ncbi:transglycosylase domain-containing protein [Chitinispirillales bacterium ANBcel5]|uniref:biosynthetic peptidoglycan transglycosylase n=1 Tax=Cellulosispirillum alkaliphilum TaxID=3039283 RepID=UPI002A5108FC|nr:transglycosylase domain-containing protein [Chitinispirillales bacterium ANBcel5]